MKYKKSLLCILASGIILAGCGEKKEISYEVSSKAYSGQSKGNEIEVNISEYKNEKIIHSKSKIDETRKLIDFELSCRVRINLTNVPWRVVIGETKNADFSRGFVNWDKIFIMGTNDFYKSITPVERFHASLILNESLDKYWRKEYSFRGR